MCGAHRRLYAGVTKMVNVPTGGTAMTTAVRTHVEPNAERVAIGERLGFYEVMSEAPVTETELARRTGAAIGFVAHWLADQARRGYLVRDTNTGRYANWCGLPLAA
jgi:hypothetical protein